MLCSGVGMWLRWPDRQAVYFRASQAALAVLLGAFYAIVFGAVTVAFVASFFVSESYALMYGLRPASLFLVLLSAGPPTLAAARICLSRKFEEQAPGVTLTEKNRSEAVEQEISLAFLVVAGLCFLGSWTLYADANDPDDWDTIRLFLRVCTAVSLYAGSLVLVGKMLRRLMLSLLFTLHFMGIATAALSAPPSPLIVQHAWIRLFRPYLQFCYLNNAYHFYAPDPGPSGYGWFRVIFENPQTKKQEGIWCKIPDVDDDGTINHPLAFDYQRFLSMTESIKQLGTPPAESYVNPETKAWETNPFWKRRLDLAQTDFQSMDFAPPTSGPVRAPTIPGVPYQQQVSIPSEDAKPLVASYARFVARKYPVHPDKPDFVFKSVKVYHVIHVIPTVKLLCDGYSPTDPGFYRPIYLGNFDADGTLLDVGKNADPYLYWIIPSWREAGLDPDSQIYDFARLHAGDPNYARRGSDKKWVSFEERDPPRKPARGG
jgi:hypothetical protein